MADLAQLCRITAGQFVSKLRLARSNFTLVPLARYTLADVVTQL